MGVYVTNVHANDWQGITNFDLYNTDTKESINVTKEQLYAAIDLGRIHVENIRARNNRLSSYGGEIARYRTISTTAFVGEQILNEGAVIITGEDKENNLYRILQVRNLKETIMSKDEFMEEYRYRLNTICNANVSGNEIYNMVLKGRFEQFKYKDSEEINKYKRKVKMLDIENVSIITYGENRITAEVIENVRDNGLDIVIPAGVTELCSSAFRKGKYGRVSIPRTVTKISNRAFESTYIDELEIEVNEDLTVEYSVFRRCHVNRLIIQPESKVLPDNIFEYITVNERLIIPDKLKNLGKGQKINLNNNDLSYLTLDLIDDETFRLHGNNEFKLPNNIKSIGKFGISVDKTIDYLKIPNTIKTIGYNGIDSTIGKLVIEHNLIIQDGAFIGNGIDELHINSEIEFIGKRAFSECRFKKVVINNKIDKIGLDAFNDKSREGKYTLELNILPNEIDMGAFGNASIDTIIIDKDINPNGDGFENCNIHKMYIDYNKIDSSKSVIYKCNIGILVINSDKSLNRWVIGGSKISALKLTGDMEVISDETYRNCGIEQLILPGKLKYIDARAFNNNKITSVIIPRDIKYIGESAFAFNKITNLQIESNDMEIYAGAFIENNIDTVRISINNSIDKFAFDEDVRIIRV